MSIRCENRKHMVGTAQREREAFDVNKEAFV